MAVTRTETQITWAAAAFIDLGAGAISRSDAFTLAADTYAAGLSVWADNQGTPASGDIVNVYIAWTNGEVDGTAGDDFDTEESRNLTLFGALDTFANALDGAAPDNGVVQKTMPEIPIGAKGFRLVVDSDAASIVKIRARINEVKSGV